MSEGSNRHAIYEHMALTFLLLARGTLREEHYVIIFPATNYRCKIYRDYKLCTILPNKQMDFDHIRITISSQQLCERSTLTYNFNGYYYFEINISLYELI